MKAVPALALGEKGGPDLFWGKDVKAFLMKIIKVKIPTNE